MNIIIVSIGIIIFSYMFFMEIPYCWKVEQLLIGPIITLIGFFVLVQPKNLNTCMVFSNVHPKPDNGRTEHPIGCFGLICLKAKKYLMGG